MRLIPNSNGEPEVPLREFNPNHEPPGSPKGGQFARRGTRVGITSARPGQSEGVYAHMKEFEHDLTSIPGVSHVSVKAGIGAWQGGAEPSWIVSYVGNGEARKLLAHTAVRYKQEAVLLMGRCPSARTGCDPVVDLRFERPITQNQMRAINQLLGAAGFGGWTWGAVGGKTVLRVASVPEWGGVTSQHVKGMAHIGAELARLGFKSSHRVRWLKTEVMDEKNYAAVIEGKA